MKPKPIKAPKSKGERNVFCDRDTDCIDEAIRQGWKGFSCTKCRYKGSLLPIDTPCYLDYDESEEYAISVDIRASLPFYV